MSSLLSQKGCLEQTMDDLENLYSNDMELLTMRMSDKDEIIRDLEGRLYESEEFRLRFSGEIAGLLIFIVLINFSKICFRKEENLFLNEEINRLKFTTQQPPMSFMKMAPRENNSFFGNHSNRSKSTALMDSNEKFFDRGEDNMLKQENEKLKRLLEEKELVIENLRV